MRKAHLKGYRNALLIFIGYYSITFFVPLIFFYFTVDYFLTFNSDFLKLIIGSIETVIALIILVLIWRIGKKNKLRWINQSYTKKYSTLIFFIILPVVGRMVLDPFFRFNEIFSGIDLHAVSGKMNNEKFNYSNVLALLNIVILGSIIEEIVFRGYILKALSNNANRIKILFSSLLFALIHMPIINITSLDIPPFLAMFFFGIILSLIALKLGLTYAIVFHILYNLSWYILQQFSGSYWKLLNSLNFNYIYWGIVILSAIIFITGINKIIADNSGSS